MSILEPLYVLYAFDQNYAPFAGVSLCSLLEQSRHMELCLYAVTERVERGTLDRLTALAAHYGRQITFVDTGTLAARMDACGIPAYRGTRVANARLFFDVFLPKKARRLLYLDCDTVVCGDLAPLCALDLGGAPVAAVQDSLSARYKRLLGFGDCEPYYNSGVLLIDTAAWEAQKVSERIEKHAKTVRAAYCNPDQDLLNLVLKGEIATLHPAYNLQPHHTAFPPKAYLRVYRQTCYYASETLEQAATAPVILHTYRYLGDFPWHAGNRHPHTSQWDAYLAKTPWNGLKKRHAGRGSAFRIEKALYRILPKALFLSLFARTHDRITKKRETRLKAKK